VPTLLSLSDLKESLKPFLKVIVERVATSLIEDENLRKIVLGAFDFLIDGNTRAAASLAQSLLKLDPRTAGISDLIDLIAGKKIGNCDNIIELLKQIGINITQDVEKRLRECCNAWLSVPQDRFNPRAFIEEIIEKLQGVQINGGCVTAPFKHLENSTNDSLQHIDRISDQNGA
jgi:hypothetical protein